MKKIILAFTLVLLCIESVSAQNVTVNHSLPNVYDSGGTVRIDVSYDFGSQTVTGLSGQVFVPDGWGQSTVTWLSSITPTFTGPIYSTTAGLFLISFGFDAVDFGNLDKPTGSFSFEVNVPGTSTGQQQVGVRLRPVIDGFGQNVNSSNDPVTIEQRRDAEILLTLNQPTNSELNIAQNALANQFSHGTSTISHSATFTAVGAPTIAAVNNVFFRVVRARGDGTTTAYTPEAISQDSTPTFNEGANGIVSINLGGATDNKNVSQTNSNGTFNHQFNINIDTSVTNNVTIQFNWQIPSAFFPLNDTLGDVYLLQIFGGDSSNSALQQTAQWAFNVLPNQAPQLTGSTLAITGAGDTLTGTGSVAVNVFDIDNRTDQITVNYQWLVQGVMVAAASGSVTGVQNGTGEASTWDATIPALADTNFVKNNTVQLSITLQNSTQTSDAVLSNIITVGNITPAISAITLTVDSNPAGPVYSSVLTANASGLDVIDMDIDDTVDSATNLYQWERSTDNGANFAPIAGATASTLNFADMPNMKFDKNDQFRLIFSVSDTTAPSSVSNMITSDPVVIVQNSAPTGEDKTITVSTGLAKEFSLAIADGDQDPLSINTIIAVPEDENQVAYQTSLSQRNELMIMTENSAATGSGTFMIDLQNNTIAYSITYSGLSESGGIATAVHIHGPATVCQEGGVIFDFSTAGSLASPITGTWDYSTFDFSGIAGINNINGFETAIVGGLTYVNVHTTANMAGEIRGQILPTVRRPSRTGGTAHVAVMNQSKEVASAVVVTNTDAEGEGTFVIDTEMDTVSYYITYEDLTGEATAAHIHGPAGEGTVADVLFTLNLGNPASNPPSPITGAWDYSGFTGATGLVDIAALETALTSGNTYVNIHTSSNPDGEIRGQIETERNFEAELNGNQEAPPNNSTGRGVGEFVIDVAGNTLTYNIDFSGLVTTGTTPGTTMAHIHGPTDAGEAAGFGKNNGVLFNLNIGTELFSGNLNGVWDYTDGGAVAGQDLQDRENAILNGQTYVNIHSDQFPDGEIRGQITPFVFRLNESLQLDSVTNSTASYTFNPGNAVDGDRYQFTYQVKDDDHAASNVHTVTLNVVDNLPPQVVTDSASPVPANTITGSNEGTTFPFSVTATDSNDPYGTGAIADVEWLINNTSSAEVDANGNNDANFVASFDWVTNFDTIANVNGNRPRMQTFTITARIKDNLGATADVVWTVDLGDVDRNATAPVNGITPDPAQTQNTLTANINTVSTDPDGDAIVGYQHTWENITMSAAAAVMGDTLANSNFVKGNMVRLTSRALTDPYDEANDIVSSNAATQNIAISNTLPVATAQTDVPTNEDTELAIDLNAVDPDVDDSVDTLTFATVSQPTNGTLVNLDTATGMVTYRPNTNFHGTDSFTFTASDGAGGGVSAAATVSILIYAVNDNPTVPAEGLSTFSKANRVGDTNNVGLFTMTGDDIDNTSGNDSSMNMVNADDASTLKYQLETTFRVTIENLSTSTTLGGSHSCSQTGVIPFAPGVWAVHNNNYPMFQNGRPDFNKGLEELAEDGNNAPLAETIAAESGIISSNGFGGTGDGKVMRFYVSAVPGEKLSFATMFVPSNDLFYAPSDLGIDLFPGGTPLNGNITDQIELWDAGTERNEALGEGLYQPQCRTSSTQDPRPAEGAGVSIVPNDGSVAPTLNTVIKVTVTPVTTFTVKIENLSTASTLSGTCNPSGAVPLAPGVWAVHDTTNSPMPLFTVGSPDRGAGLEALAEDGVPGTLGANLKTTEGTRDGGIVGSNVFDTPVGANAPSGIGPGGAFQFNINAVPGERLSFATMFVPSNDLFFAPAGAGIDLFPGNNPISGDITDDIDLWNGGTEIDEPIGNGLHQAQCQAANAPDNRGTEGNGLHQAQCQAANAPDNRGTEGNGTEVGGTVTLVSDGSVAPANNTLIRVTITPSTGKGVVRHKSVGGADPAPLSAGELITGLEELEFLPNLDERGLVILRYVAIDSNGGFSSPTSIRIAVGTPPWFPFIDLDQFTSPAQVAAGETYRVLIELDPGNDGQITEILKTTIRTTASKSNVGPIDYLQAGNTGLRPSSSAGGTYGVTVSRFNTGNMMFERVGTEGSLLTVEDYADATITGTITDANAVFDSTNEVWNFSFELDTVSAYKFSVMLRNTTTNTFDTTILDLTRIIQPDGDVIQLSGAFNENNIFLERAGDYRFTVTPINPKNLAGDSTQAGSTTVTVSANDAVVVTAVPAGVTETTMRPGIAQLDSTNANFVAGIASADNANKAVVTLAWDRVGRANNYSVYVATVGGMAVELTNNGNTNGNNFFNVSLAPGQYRWHVITRNDVGSSETWSLPRYFQINPEPTFDVPVLSDIRVKAIPTVGSSQITIILDWIVIEAEKVFVRFVRTRDGMTYTAERADDVQTNNEITITGADAGFDIAEADVTYLVKVTPIQVRRDANNVILGETRLTADARVKTYIPADVAATSTNAINRLSFTVVDVNTTDAQSFDTLDISGFGIGAGAATPTHLEFEASIRRFGTTRTNGFETEATSSPLAVTAANIGAVNADALRLALTDIFQRSLLATDTITIVKIRVRGTTSTLNGPWSRQFFFVVR